MTPTKTTKKTTRKPPTDAQREQWKAEAAEKREAAQEKLEAGILDLTNSESWSAALTVASKFWRYSFNNQILIQIQCPEATSVASYKVWQSLGRKVIKGEKGIRILRPNFRKGDPAKGEREDERILCGFGTCCVFDVSQTEGDPLPNVDVVSLLTGEGDDSIYASLVQVAEGLGFTVRDAGRDELGRANGDCCASTKRIRVLDSNSGVQRIKTLAHEIGHAILHGDDREGLTRPDVELEAESVAFIVCDHLGIQSDDYSFGYVATWAGGAEAVKTIQKHGQRIQRAAKQIIENLTGVEGEARVAA